MIQSLLICVLAVATATAAPQFVTFKDGKIGVNFAGYNAEAGLGGLLTGNAAHGGLSASAGTPFGQRAAAGIGGLVNGDAAGRAYAGAQASDSIGASAILGGNTGPKQRGIIGAEAHSNGNAVSKTITSGVAADSSPELIVPTDLPKDNAVQKIKPPKKYSGVESSSSDLAPTAAVASSNGDSGSGVVIVKEIQRHHKHIRPAHRHHLHKHVIYEPVLSQSFNGDGEKNLKITHKLVKRAANPQTQITPETVARALDRFGGEDTVVTKKVRTTYKSVNAEPSNQDGYQVVDKNVQVTPGSLNQWFNIPIGILQSIRDNLSPLNVRKQVTYSSSA